MDNSELIILNINSICRVCLLENENMKDLLNVNENFFEMFVDVVTFEVMLFVVNRARF